MKRFVIRTILFVLPLMAVMIVTFSLEGGYSDAYYLRFTSPVQNGLITGNSRAAQGLMPSVINSHLDSLYDSKVYNYSFTLTSSPYGRPYFNSIKKKIDPAAKNGIFILAVDPWSISVASGNPDDERSFPEEHNFMAELDDVTSEPNFEYLLNHYSNPYYNIILRRISPRHLRIHEDGWLNVSVSMDTVAVERRAVKKFRMYQRFAQQFKYSHARMTWLQELINLLKRHGNVFLVRLPVHDEILKSEKLVIPDFNEKMNILSGQFDVPYLDLTGSNMMYRYIDGNHLHKSSSAIVSRVVAEWIKQYHAGSVHNDAIVKQ